MEILSSDWEEEQVSSPNILRLIYQGRFLHGNVTLGGMKIIFIICVTIRQKAIFIYSSVNTALLFKITGWPALYCCCCA